MEDELDALFVEESEALNKNMLRDLLAPFVKMTTQGTILPEDNFISLDNTQKVAVYLLSRKVMKLKGILEAEAAGPTSISEAIGLPVGSVKTVFHTQGNKLFKSENGTYFIPNYNLVKIKQILGRW